MMYLCYQEEYILNLTSDVSLRDRQLLHWFV